jgi:hypothetical protein
VPVRIAAFGDAATYFIFPGTVSTVSTILALNADEDVDFVTNIGDLAYAEGSVLLWTFWTGLFWPISSQLPFMVTVRGARMERAGSHTEFNPPFSRGAGWKPRDEREPRLV